MREKGERIAQGPGERARIAEKQGGGERSIWMGEERKRGEGEGHWGDVEPGVREGCADGSPQPRVPSPFPPPAN